VDYLVWRKQWYECTLTSQSRLCLESEAMFGAPGEHYLSAEKDAMAAAAAGAGAAATDDANNAAPAGIRMDGGSKL
jgi:hypothetical protein